MVLKNIATLSLLLALGAAPLAATARAQEAPKQTPPAGGPPKAFTLPKKETFALDNGVKVTLVPYG